MPLPRYHNFPRLGPPHQRPFLYGALRVSLARANPSPMMMSALFPMMRAAFANNPKSPFGQVGVPGASQDTLSKLSDEEAIKRKKRLYSAGSPLHALFGMTTGGSPMV